VRSLRSLYLAVGAAMGSFFPFLVVILAGRGFDPAQIGVATAAASVAYTSTVPAWGHLGDVTLGRARALQLGTIGAAVAVGLFALPLPMLAAAGLVVVFNAFQSSMQPLSDALALAHVPDRGRDYGRVRLLASLAFAVTSVACGVLYDRVGFWATAPVFAVAAAWICLSVIRLREPAPGRTRHRGPDDSRPTAIAVRPGIAAAVPAPARRSRLGTAGEALTLQPRLRGVLLAIGLIHVGVLASFTYLPLRITDLGGGPELVALAAGISALAEVPGILLAGAVAARIGLRGLFAVGSVAYAACIASWIVIDAPAAIVATRAITGVAFGGILVASALTIGSLLPRRLQATGQALYQTVAFGLAAIVANLGGGLIYASVGSSLMFALTAAAALGAAVVGAAVLPVRGAATSPLDESAVAVTLTPDHEVPLGM
jgi:MFS transporter, PPP family, 3-phenylpropionic acid transporter